VIRFLDDYLVEEIRELYSVPSAGDLVIDSVKANKMEGI
jgi:hypothetical protein